VTDLYLPWIEAAVALPLAGTPWIQLAGRSELAWRRCLILCGLTLLCSTGAWLDFAARGPIDAQPVADLTVRLLGTPVFAVDALSAPLLPLASLLYFLTVLSALQTRHGRVSYTGLLVSQSVLLATLACQHSWMIVGCLAAGVLLPWLEMRAAGKPTRVFAIHMLLLVALLVLGQAVLSANLPAPWSHVGVALLVAAVLLRSGIVPVHCWMTDLFEHASFATALLFITPMVGAYAAVRLVLPVAPDWALRSMVILSTITALYAACMALVQREARRFFCYLFLSHSSLVFVGLETGTPVGLTGALCVWLSVGLSLAGFGLTLRAIEARTDRLSLDEFHGLYEHTPRLATLFLLTGLASIGFPGTVGFVGADLLVDGAVQAEPLIGVAIVLAAALNGLAVLQAYFRIFTGTRHMASIDLSGRPPERFAVLVLALLILGGGLHPQPAVASRYRVATELIEKRRVRLAEKPDPAAKPGAISNLLRQIAPHWQ
jgi:NADH-quinone oxidoreductase subunit M